MTQDISHVLLFIDSVDSFRYYQDSEDAQSGSLWVINEDRVAPTRFSAPTRKFELFSCSTTTNAFSDKDSIGNIDILKCGDLQLTTTGTGISHEKNARRYAGALPADLIPPLHRAPSAEALHAPLHRRGEARRVGAGMVDGGGCVRKRWRSRRQSLPCGLPASR
ncbi:hypothetical protein C8R44DRAFT_974135 [Mycena epipterygia]|nr:hypothetical protein C8R44DRAFT_974135 [Mycena epipterygia]